MRISDWSSDVCSSDLMNRGIPSHRFLAGAYWRNRAGMPADFSTADPAEDGCGLLWFPPVLPFTGAAVKEFLGLAEPIFARYDFDFFVTFSSVTVRARGAVMTIAYDLQVQAESSADESTGGKGWGGTCSSEGW